MIKYLVLFKFITCNSVLMCPSIPTSTHRESSYQIEIFSSLKKRRKKLQPRTNFLTLRKVAARALSAATAAGAGERNWSTYSFFVNRNRNFLKPERVDAIPLGVLPSFQDDSSEKNQNGPVYFESWYIQNIVPA